MAKLSDANLVDQISELFMYLSDLGYMVSTDTILSIFHLIPGVEQAELSLLTLEPYLKPLVVKTAQESAQFHQDLVSFVEKRPRATRRGQLEEAKRRYDQECAALEEKRKKLMFRQEKKQAELKSLGEREDDGEPPALSERKKKSLDKKFAEIEKAYKQLLKNLKDKDLEKKLLSLNEEAARKAKPFSKAELEKMAEALKMLLPLAAFSGSKIMPGKTYKDVMDYVRAEAALIQDLLKGISPHDEEEAKRRELMLLEQKLAFNQREYEDRLEKFRAEVEQINRQIDKVRSTHHRMTWATPHNAVRSTYSGDLEALSKPFDLLTHKEREQISDYIRENAQKFKTKMSSNVRTGDKHRLDMAETCKRACATNGVPMRLCYEKPKADQANLLLVLDVSGSCKEASQLMLTFMYYMRDAFPGGCATFAFVNSLYDISDYLDKANADEAIGAVLESIPRRGVYSNYNKPLQELCAVQLPKVNRDTIIIFIGDARNNKNPSGEEYMKRLARKSRHAYWFNTEGRGLWDTNDSIMSLYSQYMRQVGEVLNTEQLINLLMEVR